MLKGNVALDFLVSFFPAWIGLEKEGRKGGRKEERKEGRKKGRKKGRKEEGRIEGWEGGRKRQPKNPWEFEKGNLLPIFFPFHFLPILKNGKEVKWTPPRFRSKEPVSLLCLCQYEV